MAFLNAVAEVAEAETHHPDLHLTSYRDVRLDLSTHAVGGCARIEAPACASADTKRPHFACLRLTQPDFILAAKLDALPVDYSPKWLREHAAAAEAAAAAAAGGTA
jgi:4a-hydroxytetrahydrobiopterin dehydratase